MQSESRSERLLADERQTDCYPSGPGVAPRRSSSTGTGPSCRMRCRSSCRDWARRARCSWPIWRDAARAESTNRWPLRGGCSTRTTLAGASSPLHSTKSLVPAHSEQEFLFRGNPLSLNSLNHRRRGKRKTGGGRCDVRRRGRNQDRRSIGSLRELLRAADPLHPACRPRRRRRRSRNSPLRNRTSRPGEHSAGSGRVRPHCKPIRRHGSDPAVVRPRCLHRLFAGLSREKRTAFRLCTTFRLATRVSFEAPTLDGAAVCFKSPRATFPTVPKCKGKQTANGHSALNVLFNRLLRNTESSKKGKMVQFIPIGLVD